MHKMASDAKQCKGGNRDADEGEGRVQIWRGSEGKGVAAGGEGKEGQKECKGEQGSRGGRGTSGCVGGL
ncbi:hypothetical protein E2C01_059382 [Portunus trituberculatus]|uniref:Uncharacterized protein n=1 Tax=Portunus trituberculatus TaxID=210409 RepID=A0A5B7H5Y1_PORTR|nr:hypothetical protein [Portunus trituberculatus]